MVSLYYTSVKLQRQRMVKIKAAEAKMSLLLPVMGKSSKNGYLSA